MPRDGNGIFTVPNPDFVSGTVVSSDKVDANNSDISTAITQSIAVDGQTTITANLPMFTYRHTGVGNASARTDYASAGQVTDGALTWGGTAGGTADALTLSLSPAITAYATNMRIGFKASASANTGAATVSVNGLTAKAIELNDAALAAGTILANKYYEIYFDGTAFQLTRLGVSLTSITAGTGLSGGTITTSGTIAIDTAVVPQLASTNVFTATQTVQSASGGEASIDTTATTAGLTGSLRFRGLSSTSVARDYGGIKVTSSDTTNTSEDGRVDLSTISAGTSAVRTSIANGLYMAGATGGDKGGGSINAAALYENGSQIINAGLVLIGTVAASSSAFINVTGLDSTYDTFLIELSDMVPATDGDAAWLRVGDSAGVDNGVSDYSWSSGILNVGDASISANMAATDAQIVVSSGSYSVGSAAGEGFGGSFKLHRPGDGSVRPIISGTMAATSITGNHFGGWITGSRLSVITLDRVQFRFSTGNITSGRMTVWGLKHA